MTRIIKSMFYGSVVQMTERKFNIPLILLAAASFAIGFFGFAVESIVLAVGVIIASVKLREKYLIKIPVSICIISIVASGAFLALMIYHSSQGMSSSSYWLIKLLFGSPE